MGISLNPLKLFSRGKHVRLIKPGDDFYPDELDESEDGAAPEGSGDRFAPYRSLPYVVNSGDDFNWELNRKVLNNIRLIERIRRSRSEAFPVPKFEVRKPVRLGSVSLVTIGEYVSDMPSREDIEQHWVPQFGGGEYVIYAKSAAYTGPVIGYKFPGAPKWQTPDEAIREARKKEAEKPKTFQERLDERATDDALAMLDSNPAIRDKVATARLYKAFNIKPPKEEGDEEDEDPLDKLDKAIARAEKYGFVRRTGTGDSEDTHKTSLIDLVMELARTQQLEPLVARLTALIPQQPPAPTQPQVGGAPQQPALGPGQPQRAGAPQSGPQPRAPQPVQPTMQPTTQEAPVDTAQLLNKLKTRLKGTDLMGLLKAADWDWLKNALSLRPTEFVQKLYADLQAQKPGLSELEVILHEFTVDEVRVLLSEVKKLLDNPFIRVLASATMDAKALDTVSAVAAVLITPAGTTWLTSVKQGIDLTYKAVENSMNRAGVEGAGEAQGDSGGDDISGVGENGPDDGGSGGSGVAVVVRPPDKPKSPAPVAAVVDIVPTLVDDDSNDDSNKEG